MSETQKRVAIIGAGPVGLEAALALREDGYEVHVFEQGEVGDSVRAWGHVSLFSPWALNVSPRGRAVLEAAGLPAPEADAFPTGKAYAEGYLDPLAATLDDALHTRTRVVGVARAGRLKGDAIGDPARASTPFRLLVERDGRERVVEADIVIDASGTWCTPNNLGDGGLPAPGERTAAAAGRILYRLPDVAAEPEAFAGHIVVVGAGYSAATTLAALAELGDATRVTWLTREEGAPCTRIPDDPLPDRDRLAAFVNGVATEGHPTITHRGGVTVDAVEPDAGRLRLRLRPDGAVTGVDRVVAQVGFRPNTTLLRELQVHQCWASEGPMKLAAALLAQDGGGSADCLAQTSLGPETLKSPEPGLYLLGARSYGRRSDFLIKLGVEQVEELRVLLREAA